MNNDDIDINFIENLPHLKLWGSSKFKTPRCINEKIPILVLPECNTIGISTFKDKTYLNVSFEKEKIKCFQKIIDWVSSTSSKPLYPFITDDQMKIKLPPDMISVINVDGTESTSFSPPIGCLLRCAVELTCVWENSSHVGISFQLVQCKILRCAKCLISQMDENPEYIPFVSK